MRSFDPRVVGGRECRAWETYYRREWLPFLGASVGLVRATFGMSWSRTLVGAWLVLRANQVWAPYPNNDPDSARSLMARFYALLRRSEQASFDPLEAARLEVEWWRVHREAQHGDGSSGSEELDSALADLYAEQRQSRNDDAIGYVFLLAPVASMSGGDLRHQIALRKGEHGTVQQAANRRCLHAARF